MKYTNQIERAIKIATYAHRNQKRKGTDLPYISHLFSVMLILSEYTEDEDTLIAGLLHDVLEDTNINEYGRSEIEKDFGKKVLKIIQEVSESKNAFSSSNEEKDTWKCRKIMYLKHLEKASAEALLISSADKLHSLISTTERIREEGSSVWNIFNAPKGDQLWFYEEFIKILQTRLPKHPLVERVLVAIAELEK